AYGKAAHPALAVSARQHPCLATSRRQPQPQARATSISEVAALATRRYFPRCLAYGALSELDGHVRFDPNGASLGLQYSGVGSGYSGMAENEMIALQDRNCKKVKRVRGQAGTVWIVAG